MLDWLRGLTAHFDRGNRSEELAVIGDGAGWSLDHDAEEIIRVVRTMGAVASASKTPRAHQPAFFASRVAALRQMDRWHRMGVAVCFPYFHGYPGEGEAIFDETLDRLRRSHHQVARIQVTHQTMRALVLDTGIDPAKVHTILIGIDTAAFTIPAAEQRRLARARFDIPESAVVIGSFQKDGNGWGDGDEPKLIKGPDVLLDVLSHLKPRVRDLFVLLSGPSRGFVRRGLERLGIPYRHTQAQHYRGVPQLYHALDAYVVSSRQEGGPKAILESMASGVPIVSTRVGQAPALIEHGRNGWLANVDDVAELAQLAEHALQDDVRQQVIAAARVTAEANDYRMQVPQWRAFFDGVLRIPVMPR